MLLILLNTAFAGPWSLGPSVDVLTHTFQSPPGQVTPARFIDYSPLGLSATYTLRENIELSASGSLHLVGNRIGTFPIQKLWGGCWGGDCDEYFSDGVRRTGLLRVDAALRDEGPGVWGALGGAFATRNYEQSAGFGCCDSYSFSTQTPMAGPTASIGWRQPLWAESWTLDTGLTALWFPGRDSEEVTINTGTVNSLSGHTSTDDASGPWMVLLSVTPRWSGQN